jgi:hypothetical protein
MFNKEDETEAVCIIEINHHTLSMLVAQVHNKKVFICDCEYQELGQDLWPLDSKDKFQKLQKWMIDSVDKSGVENIQRIQIIINSDFTEVDHITNQIEFNPQRAIRYTDIKRFSAYPNNPLLVSLYEGDFTFYADGKQFQNPIGVISNRLTSEGLYLYMGKKEVTDLIHVFNGAGFLVDDVTASSLLIGQGSSHANVSTIRLFSHGLDFSLRRSGTLIHTGYVRRSSKCNAELLQEFCEQQIRFQDHLIDSSVEIHIPEDESIDLPAPLANAKRNPYSYPDWAIEPTKRPEFIPSLNLISQILKKQPDF